VSLLAEMAGVARVQPPLRKGLLGGLGVLVVPDEDGAAAGEDLSVVGDAYLGSGNGLPHRVEMDLVAAMDAGDVADLGLPVDLPQRHADGVEEAQDVGTERRSARGGAAQVAHPETILEGAEEQ